MDFVFYGGSIEECLKKASQKLDISKNELKYKIIKEERKFFKKNIEIQILNNLEKDKNNGTKVEESLNYGAKVEKEKIVIKKMNDVPIRITCSDKIKLFLNNERCDEIEDATEDDEITYEFEKEEERHTLEVFISEDKMKCFITIKSFPRPVYKLVDCDFTNNLVLKSQEVSKIYSEKFTKDEIINQLTENGVTYGIIEESIDEACNKENVENLLIAKGTEPIDDIKDTVEVMFNKKQQFKKDAKIDYRNMNSISNVKKGDLLARRIPGKEGKDGIDVFGKAAKRKIENPIVLKAGTGCAVCGDEVISEIQGKASMKHYIFSVHEIYEIKEVDLTSGNINFIGDVDIINNVTEGMKVNAGRSISVGKNVEYANLYANNSITVRGSVLNSTLKAGANIVEETKHLENIKQLEQNVEGLILCVKELSEKNLLTDNKIGEIIKILLESKFKNISSKIETLLDYYKKNEIPDHEIPVLLKKKLTGMGPLRIKNVSELVEIKKILSKEEGQAEQKLDGEADISIEYCQGANIEAAGNVYINGKGQFTSNIVALNNIEFTRENAVCRGGTLSAKNEIKIKTVGSTADVKTILKVSRKGKISADFAYSNTIFCFGERQFILDVSSKNVVAYLDENDEIMIEKLHL